MSAAGPRNATTGQWGVREYKWQDVPLLSVTSLRSLAGMALPLVAWIKAQIAQTAVDNIDAFAAQVALDGDEARKWLQRESDIGRDKAADLGKAVHQAIGENIRPHTISDPVMAGMVEQGYAAHRALGLTIVSSERQVFNLTWGYGGSYDCIASDPTGKTWLIDYKTGKGAYPDAAIQTILYRLCEFVGADGVIDEAATALLKSVTGLAVLHLREKGWEWIPISIHGPEGAALRQAALGMVTFAKWVHKHPAITDVSDAVRLTNPIEGFITFGDLS